MSCTVCHKPTTSGSRHPECGALLVSVMEAADRYWDAGSGARYRARDKLEAAVVAAIRGASTAGGGGMRAAMVKLSKALGHPNPVDCGSTQCVEAALIELAAERLTAPGVAPTRGGEQ